MISYAEMLVIHNFKSNRGVWPQKHRKSHHLLSAAVAGVAGVAEQPVLAAGGRAARPIRRQQGTPLLGETDWVRPDWVKTTGGNIAVSNRVISFELKCLLLKVKTINCKRQHC